MKTDVKIRFINSFYDGLKILYKHGIDIEYIDYREDGPVYTISIDDLDKLEAYDLEILSFRGFKNIVLKFYRKRHFIAAIMLSILLMFILSNFCFAVNIIHSDKNIRTLIEDELYDHGIRPFMPKKSFKRIQEIKNHIKSTYPNDIEWLEIIDDGMKYTVRVEERILTSIPDDKDFCNVISKKDATINSITSSKGQNVVGTNDLVKKGDVLISGEIKFNEETKSHTCANGTVYGNTWYQVAVSIPLEHTVSNYTGKKKNNLAIEVGTKYTRIFKVHFDEFEAEKKALFKFGSFAIYKETIKEITKTKEKYTKEQALEEAKKEGQKKLKTNLGEDATILDEKVLQSEDYNSIISIEFFYSVKEIISETVVEEYVKKDEELE